MQIEFLPPSALEAKTEIREKEGKVVSYPIFYGNGGDDSTVMVVQIKNDKGEVLSQGNLVLNGRTGKLAMRDRTTPVVPLFEKGTGVKKKSKKTGATDALEHE